LPGGSNRSAPRRTRAVHILASSSSATCWAWRASAARLDGGDSGSPVAGSVADRSASYTFPFGNGSTRAAPKITTMTAISMRFATDTVKIDQCR